MLVNSEALLRHPAFSLTPLVRNHCVWVSEIRQSGTRTVPVPVTVWAILEVNGVWGYVFNTKLNIKSEWKHPAADSNREPPDVLGNE